MLSKVINVGAGRTHEKWASIPLPVLIALIGMKAGPAEAVREQGRQANDPSPLEELFTGLGLGDVLPQASGGRGQAVLPLQLEPRA